MVSRVRVVSVTHVRPSETSNPLPNNENDDDRAIKLSLFDAMLIPLHPMQQLFIYEGDDLPPFPAMLGTLQSSLAATLAVYIPLAGQVAVSKTKPGDVVIDCSPDAVSQGVRFVEAEYAGSTDSMRLLANDADHDTEAYAQLVPGLVVSPLPVPTLAVQVTRPADSDRAVVVGVSMSHVVCDGQALCDFLRAWSAAARGSSPTFLPPVFDRALINRHPKAEAVARTYLRIFAPALPTVKALPKPVPTQQMRRTYLLSASQIRCLKQRIISLATVAKPPSTYIAVASLVWTASVRARNSLSRADDDAYLMFPGDCRAHLRPPMPATFFGNCVKVCYARATVGELRDRDGANTLARAASAVREAIQEQMLGDPLADADRWRERQQALPRDRLVHLGSSNRFFLYETDFGWGKPTRTELASVFGNGNELVAMIAAPEGAVQVSVALDRRNRMEDFEANFLSQLHALARL